MRILIIAISIFILTQSAYNQNIRYQTYTSVMMMSGIKNGETYQWENKNIIVTLDYQVGNFIVRLYNTDFQFIDQHMSAKPDSIQDRTEYQLTGIFPIRDILNQKSISQNYNVELQLINDEKMMSETLNFNMTITRPNSSQGDYMVFMLSGILYKDNLQLPAFEGFDNEIDLKIAFNGFMKR